MYPRSSDVDTDTWTALDALDVSPLPFLLVACKCDLRPEVSELSVAHEQYEIYRTSPEAPRSQQMCIALVLRSVISNRGMFRSAIHDLWVVFSLYETHWSWGLIV